MKTIYHLLDEFNAGLDGKGPILWHKKPHKKGFGESACVKGIIIGCDNPIGCENCYIDKTGGYCIHFGGESVGGFLVVEPKHQGLVNDGAYGAYNSIKSALEGLK